MPLNLNDPEDSSVPESQPKGPIFHEPGTGGPNVPVKLILLILGGVVLVGGLIYAWKSEFFISHAPQAQYTITPQKEETVKPVEQQPPLTQTESAPVPSGSTPSTEGSHPAAAPRQKSIPPKSAEPRHGTGNYTIYISRQNVRWRADEESGRWNAAGYESVVTERGGWFVVSVGRYASWEEAKNAATMLQDGFEAGYLIGTIGE